MFKKFFNVFNIKKKIYYIPVMYSIFSLLFSFIISYIDYVFIQQVTIEFPVFFVTGIELGRTIFSTLIGALLTMITITFSTMLVVLTLYGSQLSPRAMQDFLEKKSTLQTLGYFSGVFIFSIVSLFFMKSSQVGALVLSPAIGVVAAVFCIFVFIYFINDVSKSIQVNLFIQALVDENLALIERKFEINEADNGITSVQPAGFEETIKTDPIAIESPASGFIQLYYEQRLFEFAKEKNVIINCEKKIGEHVLEGTVLISIYNADANFTANLDANVEYLLKSILIGDETNKYDDVELGLKKMVEIGVRALSPGVNDPSTAIYCIKNLGYLLGRIGERLDNKFYLNEEEQAILIVENTPFVKLLYQSFYQIRLYGASDLFVNIAIIEALTTIAKGNSKAIKNQIWEFGTYVIQSLDSTKLMDLDIDHLNDKIYQLALETNRNPSGLLMETKKKQIILS
ncbi:DUF2254 domain-containing protein [Clostridium sp. 'deep sea']|uniref:DUF2254 domain-containing protein n=1 Tax=Clostridium sp. 'deep sea' TaxID=2779445 RepID=UPI0018967A09|nr:DUF2254 domain-containing protein [Clostridium sp. 'deep sea']QOR34925.1 DUF2254 domain-containing protein [Clostridium sp. 'deep sea']